MRYKLKLSRGRDSISQQCREYQDACQPSEAIGEMIAVALRAMTVREFYILAASCLSLDEERRGEIDEIAAATTQFIAASRALVGAWDAHDLELEKLCKAPLKA